MPSADASRRGVEIPIAIYRRCMRHASLLSRPRQPSVSPKTHSILKRQHPQSRTYARAASKQPAQRVLEKPTRFNPPSHGNRRPRPTNHPGPRLSDAELAAQKTKRYPNTMPTEGTLSHWILTSRGLHLWITLSTLTALAGYTMLHSFVSNTAFRAELPAPADVLAHPVAGLAQFVRVYKMHVARESRLVQEKRHAKIEDARKRQEFLREHGVEPGFLTGGWMGRFGTVEGDKFREEMEAKKAAEEEEAARSLAGGAPAAARDEGRITEAEQQPARQKKKVKRWFGIWE